MLGTLVTFVTLRWPELPYESGFDLLSEPQIKCMCVCEREKSKSVLLKIDYKYIHFALFLAVFVFT